MNRRDWLRTLTTAGTAGFALLAGCSETNRDNSARNTTDEAGGSSGNGKSDSTGSRDSGTNGSGDGTTTPQMSESGATASGQALDTGQAPPSDTGTPFEDTNTVPEREGLETGQAPNATNASDG